MPAPRAVADLTPLGRPRERMARVWLKAVITFDFLRVRCHALTNDEAAGCALSRAAGRTMFWGRLHSSRFATIGNMRGGQVGRENLSGGVAENAWPRVVESAHRCGDVHSR